jgi:hypothetical protein
LVDLRSNVGLLELAELQFEQVGIPKIVVGRVSMICKTDEVWIVWTLIDITRPPVINNLSVFPIWVVLFKNSLRTSFNYFSHWVING